MALTRPRAYQIYDIDYKQAVRVVAVTNVTLSGGAPNSVDGVNLSVNDRVLVTAQTGSVQNGIYYVTVLGTGANGTWTRSIDTDTTGELLSGTIVMVTEGLIYADTQWKLITNDPITIGATALTFVQNYLANSISFGQTSFSIGSSNANANITVNGTSNVAVFSTDRVTFTGNLLPTANITYNLGTTAQRWKDLWLSNSTIYLGNISLGATDTQLTVNSANVITAAANGAISTSGNITGGNILTLGQFSTSGNVNSGNVNTTNVFATNGTFTNNVVVAGTLTSTSNIVANISGTFFGNVVTGNGAIFGGIPGYTPLGTNVVVQFAGNANSYSQVNFQNINGGPGASTDWIATANNGTDSVYFIDMGIASNTHVDNSFFGDIKTFNDAYLYVVGNAATGPGSTNVGNLLLGSTNGNIKLFVGNTAQNSVIQTISTGGVDITGRMSASGNVTGGNVVTSGVVSATGNITSAANVAGGNVIATGFVYGAELTSTNSLTNEGGQINLALPSSGSTLNGNVVIDVYQNRLRFFEGSGTNRGAYIDLTQATAGVGTNLLAGGGGGTPGGSNTQVQFNDSGLFGGNAQFTYDKATNTLTAGIIAASNNGAGTNFKVGDDIWIGDINLSDTMRLTGQQNAANAYIVFGNADGVQLGRAGTGPLTYGGAFTATGNITSGNLVTAGLGSFGTTVTATGNITSSANVAGGNVIQSGIRVAKWTTVANTAPSNPVPGDFWYDSYTDVKYQYINDGTSNVWIDQGFPTSFSTLAVTGNIIAGNLSVSTGTVSVGNIVNTNGNGVGNIGSPALYFNTVHAKATSAQYADLAEMYVADADYSPGTLVDFGGQHEITKTARSHSTQVAGVISTDPSYIMNAGQQGDFVLPVALTGKVPCWVTGKIRKGDRLVASHIPGVAAALNLEQYAPGCIIGKSLQDHDGDRVTQIQIAVGRY